MLEGELRRVNANRDEAVISVIGSSFLTPRHCEKPKQ
jgi:hypothetical protein